MNRKLEIAKNLLAEILNYLIVFAMGAVFLTDFAKAANKAELLAAVLLPLAFYAIREKCRSFLLFLFLHMLPCALVLLFYEGSIFQKIWLFLATLLLAVLSFGKKLQGGKMGMEAVFPPVFGAVIWGLYLIDQRQGEEACAELLCYIAAGFMTGYFLYYFLRQFLYYMEINNRTTENIPVNHVFRSSAFLAGGFAATAGTVMLLCREREWMNRVGEVMHRVIIGFFTLLFSLLIKGEPEEMESVSGYETAGAMPWDAGEAVEPPFILKILEVMLGILALGTAAVLIVITLLGIVRLIRERFAQRIKLRLFEDETHTDQIEKIKRNEKSSRTRNDDGLLKRVKRALSPEERIRRIYRRAIERRLASLDAKSRESFPMAGTPREWCLKLFGEQKSEALAFAGLYEKARYGSGLCDGEDVKKARKLAEAFHG